MKKTLCLLFCFKKGAGKREGEHDKVKTLLNCLHPNERN